MRAAIVSTATRLFAHQGFDGTPIQQIADAVGIRKPSLLYHFASKDDLRQAVLDDVLSRWKDTLPRILLAATAGEEQFDLITREIVNFFDEDPDRARLLIREALDRPADMAERLATHVRPLVANLAGYAHRGQERGRIWNDVDPEAYMFQTIVFLLSGVAFSDSFASLMPARSSRGKPRERLDRELIRMAKSSLFVDASASASASAPARSQARPKTRVKRASKRGLTKPNSR